MQLLSQLFQGDPALEAAANADSAHIKPGARGPHVEKIQRALNILEEAGLEVDGSYGPATAKAVLSYKKQRNIINRAYQSAADNIVGKMTIAKLDEEMLAHERLPLGQIELIPISPRADREKAYPRLNFAATKSKSFVPMKVFNILPSEVITIDLGGIAEIEVKNGKGYELSVGGYEFEPAVRIIAPRSGELVRSCEIGTNSTVIKLKGMKWGSAILLATISGFFGASKLEKLVINVKDNRPNNYHPTRAHHHEPVREPEEWNKVCEEAAKDPNLGIMLTGMAYAKASPETIATAAEVRLRVPLAFMAQWHLHYYLEGRGGVVNEDRNLRVWIERDSHARGVIAGRIRQARRSSESPVHVMFEYNQKMFDDDDARQSFGTIDNFEASADFVLGRVEIWFEDTYEWHPTYSQYTRPLKCPDNVPRDTGLVHAAMVQMKLRGAKDFQMRGKATFPMKIFPNL